MQRASSHGTALFALALALAACSSGEPAGEKKSEPVVEKVAAKEPARALDDGGAKLVILGSGTPIPEPDRSGPAAAIVAGDRAYLVDFGPGVVRRAEAAFRKGVAALDPRLLTIAFATHLHSDHTAGYADLILTPAVVGRHARLRAFGPVGLEAMTAHLRAAYAGDLEIRRASGDDLRGYEVEVAESPPPAGLVELYRDENVTVRAFAVAHGADPGARGYRFDARDRSFVVSGDTAPSPAVADACAGCDVLLHEVYCAAGLALAPPSMQAYHRSHHTSAVELGALAARAKPKLLVATHVLSFGCTEAEIVGEIASRYAGPTVIATDLDVL
jgi:ribonuclease BN (tRNA processing enzyme)